MQQKTKRQKGEEKEVAKRELGRKTEKKKKEERRRRRREMGGKKKESREKNPKK